MQDVLEETIASTAFQIVTPSRSMRCKATAASKVSIRIRQAPWANVERGTESPPQVPVTGRACSTRSASVTWSTLPEYQPCGTELRWLITAPFGKDVVPEV